MARGNLEMIVTVIPPRLEVCASSVHHRKIKALEETVALQQMLLAVTFALALVAFIIAVNA